LGVGDVHQTLHRPCHTAKYTIFSMFSSMHLAPAAP
jgi:hypothetical protein